jgi:uncharacterized protein
MAEGLLSPEMMTMITTGFLVGTYARFSTIKEDYRQFPSYPNGYLIHVVTGAVAAAIGAVAIPALLTKNFVGVSFLALAIQQFRDVRKMERDSLQKLEETELAPRGAAYIDGIAKTFESRNYFALITSFVCVLVMTLIKGHRPLLEVPVGAVAGLLAMWIVHRVTKGKTVGEYADIRRAEIRFEGDMLYVDDIPVNNVGLPDARQFFLEEGLAVMVTPRTPDASIMLANFGQRQAMLHEAARTLGLKRYAYMRRDFRNGRFCFALIPIRRDPELLLQIVAGVPILESNHKSARMRDPRVLPGQGGQGGQEGHEDNP